MAIEFVRASTEYLASSGTFNVPLDTSCCFWVKCNTFPSPRTRPFGTDTNWEGRIEVSGTINLDFYTTSGLAITSTTAITLDTWHFLVYQGSGAGGTGHDRQIWIDGVLDVTGSGGTGTATDAILQVGARTPAADPVDGVMDDFRIYDRCLTQAEIETIYNSRGTDGIVDGLIVHLPLDEGTTGTTPAAGAVIDRAENSAGNHSPVGTPTYYESDLKRRRRIS